MQDANHSKQKDGTAQNVAQKERKSSPQFIQMSSQVKRSTLNISLLMATGLGRMWKKYNDEPASHVTD